MFIGKVLLVSNHNSKWQDVLDYGDIRKSIDTRTAFHPRVISFPRCEHWGTSAFAEVQDDESIFIRWPKEDETNKKNEIDSGVMVLTWKSPSDVLVTAPYSVAWEPDDEDGKIQLLSGFQLREYFKIK